MTQAVTSFDLEGRVAVITGAAGQLGCQYAKALLGAGARVAAIDLHTDYSGRDLPEPGERFLAVKADVTRREDLAQALAAVVERLGHPRVLINNAAVDAPPNSSHQDTGPFEDYPLSSWQQMVDINLTGTFLCCQVFGGHMAKNGGGSIINISSIYGILSPDQRIYEYKAKDGKPFFKPVAYAVTKSGVLNLTRYLATYWAKSKLRVNTLTLGGVYNEQDATFLANYNAKVPLGRMADEQEYNGAILFLASDASSYMTGANLVIDGGFSSW